MHMASVKRFVSLQFLNLRQSVELIGRGFSPSQGRFLTHTSMPWVGFEPTIPVLERAKTFHALDSADTVIGNIVHWCIIIYLTILSDYIPCMTRRFVNNALAGMWKEVVVTSFEVPSICLYYGKPSQAIRYSSRDWNREPSQYMSDVVPL
jgi:hypothetical protein